MLKKGVPLLSLLLFLLICYIRLVYIIRREVNSPKFSEFCRDEVVAKIPIYPNSTLVSNDETESLPSFGNITRVYRTSDSLEDISNFYNEVSPCAWLFLPREDPNSLLCFGSPKDRDTRISFEVNITEKPNETIYSWHVGWHCEFLD